MQNISNFLKQVEEKVSSANKAKANSRKLTSADRLTHRLEDLDTCEKENTTATTTHETDTNNVIFGDMCLINSTTMPLCHNGGLCLMRRGFWSQTPSEVVVHIPFSILRAAACTEAGNCTDDDVSSVFNASTCQIHFKVHCCEINIWGDDKSNRSTHQLSLCLTHKVSPDECTWYTTCIDDVDYVVILFFKTPPAVEYPGCEWWNHVFEDDEKIDTMTCSVGADTSQLPGHAQRHAQREHARFQALSAEEQSRELNAIRTYKEVRVSTTATP